MMDFKQRMQDLGLPRSAMLVLVVVLCVMGPLNDGVTRTSGLGLLVSVVAPATMVIILFVLMLDITMTRVFASDAEEERKRQLLFASRLESWELLALTLAWTPFALRMLGLSVPGFGSS